MIKPLGVPPLGGRISECTSCVNNTLTGFNRNIAYTLPIVFAFYPTPIKTLAEFML